MFPLEKNHKLMAYIEREENGVYVASVPSLPWCHTEGDTLEEVMANMREAAILCMRNSADFTPH